MSTPLYRYKGTDRFPGIPARDLTREEFDRLPIDLQLDVEANDSYQLVKPAKADADGEGAKKEKK